ncbi:MAG: hypothetical protein VKK62_07190 [Synechococcaceae cyanobacterium]|nr:hypothetical protein [Synechococcaceae cyanobacterium]
MPFLRRLPAALLLALPLLSATPAAIAAAAPPYPEAVRGARKAADAVLHRAGREACLRGKLTRALLGLSSSCEASGQRNSLCSFADRAVVVTPMTLSFMDSTARELLQLTAPQPAAP